MSFTVQNVIDEARILWRESSTGDIFTNDQCIPFVSMAISKIQNRRTDANFDENGVAVNLSVVTAVGDTIEFDSRFRLACVYFLVAMGYARSADLQNFRARFGEYMGLFSAELQAA